MKLKVSAMSKSENGSDHEMRLNEIINSINYFTDSEKVILEYVLNNMNKVIKMSSNKLSEETFTSPATITRLCKKLGFTGFNELKFFINNEINTGNRPIASYDNWMLLKDDIQQTLEFIEKVDFTKINELIGKSKRIYAFGTSWGERHALELFMRNFLAINVHIVLIPSITEFQWITNEITNEDLVFVVSYSGSNTDLIDAVKHFQYKNIPVISITPDKKNTLANLSLIKLYYTVTELNETNSTINSEHNLFTTLHILLDAMYRKYLEARDH